MVISVGEFQIFILLFNPFYGNVPFLLSVFDHFVVLALKGLTNFVVS